MKISVALIYQLLLLFSATPSIVAADPHGSILFATLGRSRYAFDVFTVALPHQTHQQTLSLNPNEQQITDGQSVNYNGFFPDSSSIPSFPNPNPNSPPLLDALVYISERNGSSNIYLDAFNFNQATNSNRRVALQISDRVKVPLLPEENGMLSMKDRASVSGESLVYVSTHQAAKSARKSWAAVYRTHLRTGETRRLTPQGVADFSPAVSPSGEWTMVASAGEKGWAGEIQDLNTHLFVFKTTDGSQRTVVVEHGGWPSWADDFTVYFHRQSEDGWWSVYRAVVLDWSSVTVTIERITPPGLHAFTPAAARNGKFIAVATRRPNCEFRHIELFDLVEKEFVEITRPISPSTHHFNPFISFDSTRIGYHRCRGKGVSSKSNPPLLLENLRSPTPEISLFRIDGSFPSFSPDGNQIVYAGFPGVYVVNSDGSGKREIFSGTAFATAWDWKRKGVVYTSHGPTFAQESTKVDIVSITFTENGSVSEKKLTLGGENNAFPSPSPDGKFVVFRSGRSGHKNLYIMDAAEGEKGGLWRLTDGPWTDTMCNWSPDGEWIAFASDRDNPGGGSFAIYFVRPNGTGLRKVVHSGEGGRANHPWFSPDSKWFVFTSDYASVSAEPISNPHHYQPYGEIFTARSEDGSGIQRLTHNSFEDGTPTWGRTLMTALDVADKLYNGSRCNFRDLLWLGIDGDDNDPPTTATARGVRCG